MTRWLEDWYVEVLNGQITLPKILFFLKGNIIFHGVSVISGSSEGEMSDLLWVLLDCCFNHWILSRVLARSLRVADSSCNL